MDVAHAILFAKTIDISRVTADYSSAKFEIFIFFQWFRCFYVRFRGGISSLLTHSPKPRKTVVLLLQILKNQ